jgi:WD40 repeat protein
MAALDVGEARVDQIAFHPSNNGALAVAVDKARGEGDVASGDVGRVVVWNPSTDAQLGEPIAEEGGYPIALAWRPDGRELAVATDNNLVRLYDAVSHRQVGAPIESVDAPFGALSFSPDGERLATGALSGLVLQWSTATHRQLGPGLKGHSGAVTGVAYSPDGRVLASTTLGFGATRLWDAATGAPIGAELTSGRTPFTTNNFRVEHLMGSRPAFAPDGTHLATAGFDGVTTIWDLRPERWLSAACRVAGRDLTPAEWTQHVSPDGGPKRCGAA